MSKKLTAIIIDDEPDSRKSIRNMLEQNNLNVEVISECQNAQQGLESIMDAAPDIIFLDIQMPVNNGFWLADKLRALQKRPYIIFITAFDKFAIEAIKHSAFDFLTKPISPDSLSQAIKRVEKGIDEKKYDTRFVDLKNYLTKKKVRLNTIDGFVLITIDDIVFCKADGNYSHMNLANGKQEIITMQLGKIEKKLEKNFIRINKSLIINANMIEKVNRKTKLVNLNDGLQKYEFYASSSGIIRLYKNKTMEY